MSTKELEDIAVAAFYQAQQALPIPHASDCVRAAVAAVLAVLGTNK